MIRTFQSKGWRIVRLGDVSHIVMGQSPPSETYNSDGRGLYFLQGKAEFTETHPKPTKYCSKPLKTAKKGSVLISVRAPVGDVNLADQDYCIGRGLTAISLINGSNRFLFFLLKSMKDEIQSKSTGSTFQQINKTVIENLEIPLPPVSEQQRIVEILDTAFDGIATAKAKTERKIEALDELKKSLLHQAFSGQL
jgi:type I restriction enzyme S subunit